MRRFAAIGKAVALGTVGATARASALPMPDAHFVSANWTGSAEPAGEHVRVSGRGSCLLAPGRTWRGGGLGDPASDQR